ncbi:MAG: NAD(+) diphosphatase [Dehalococcoidia bacterium]
MVAYNVYGGSGIDRLVERRTDTAWFTGVLQDEATRFLVGWEHRLPVVDSAEGPRVATVSASALRDIDLRAPVLLGTLDGAVHVVVDAAGLSESDAATLLPPSARFADLREVGSLLAASEAGLAAAARSLLLWHDAQRHCGRCGAPTAPAEAGHTLVCSEAACGATHHPRIEPAAITLVTDGEDRVLLGHSHRALKGGYSCFAGFVEAGESLEEAAAREVYEEVGVDLAELRFHSSQPWPFPSQLMVGFIARAASFEHRADQMEILDARWFDRDELLACPDDDTLRLPRVDSISRRMIEDWMHRRA